MTHLGRITFPDVTLLTPKQLASCHLKTVGTWMA
jgi:hypothetical protein